MHPNSIQAPPPPRSEFLAPWPLFAVLLMGLNDHVLKARFHNEVTGKLSDFAICFFLPLFISAGLGLVWRRAPHWRLATGGLVAASAFALLEMSDAVGGAFLQSLQTVGPALGIHRVGFTRDSTDLFALVMIPLALWYGSRRLAS